MTSGNPPFTIRLNGHPFKVEGVGATATLLQVLRNDAGCNPDPSDAQIREALSHNLCRCGAHVEILQAVRLAAQRMKIVTVAKGGAGAPAGPAARDA